MSAKEFMIAMRMVKVIQKTRPAPTTEREMRIAILRDEIKRLEAELEVELKLEDL